MEGVTTQGKTQRANRKRTNRTLLVFKGYLMLGIIFFRKRCSFL
jgi:hypothetical protein